MQSVDEDDVVVSRTPYGSWLFVLPHGRLEAQPRVGLAILEVDPEYRRRGIATRLLTAYEKQALRSGVKRIVFTCAQANDPALSLYKKLGYEIIDDDEIGEYEVLVCKNLI